MIALIVSALLGLYVFLPDFLFNRLAYPFVRLKKPQQTRFEEIVSGVGVIFIPFCVTVLLSWQIWYVGHRPFPSAQSVAEKYGDYRTVFSAMYSEAYFRDHYDFCWNAIGHVVLDQARFLLWLYVLLGVQIAVVNVATVYFGELSRFPVYRKTFGRWLLARLSQWHVLLTGFMFPRSSQTTVVVDVLTSNDKLYSGTVANYFVDRDGELSGLLLHNFRRYYFAQRETDRQAGRLLQESEYWEAIPGANFYIPADKIANLNIRYEVPSPALVADLQEFINSLKLGDDVTVSLEPENPAATGDETEDEDPLTGKPGL